MRRPPVSAAADCRVLLLSLYEQEHPPHRIALPAAYLAQAGADVRAIDLSIEPLNPSWVDAADLIAISVPMHTAAQLALPLIQTLRDRNPRAALCAFGLYAQLHAAMLRERGVAHILSGNFEPALVALAARVAQASTPSQADAAASDPAAPLPRLSALPPLRAGLAPLHRYAHLEIAGERRLAGYTEATRGCLRMCRHCPVPGVYQGRFTALPIDHVLADIDAQVQLGAQHVTFGDPDFFNGPTHALRIVREMQRRWPTLTFDATIKVSHLLAYADALEEIAHAKLLFVVSALESTSDVVLDQLKKEHSAADNVRAVAACRHLGVTLRPTFVPFTPWTQVHDLCDLIDFVVEHDLVDVVDPIQLAIRLLVPPGSLLLDDDLLRPRLGPLEAATLSHAWRASDPRLDAMQAAIAAWVDASEGQDPWHRMSVIRERIYEHAGRATPAALVRPPGAAPPRLSSHWFC